MEKKNLNADRVQRCDVEKTTICLRCGKIGHSTENCSFEIPSIESLKRQMEAKTRDSISCAPKEWIEDEMGLYLPVKNRVAFCGKTWKDGRFCFNCGMFGHDADECKEPPFETLNNMFEPYLTDNSQKATIHKKQIIDAINKFCEHDK